MEPRKDLNSNSKIDILKALATSLQTKLNEMRDIFANAFAEGKQKPEGLVFHQLAIFNMVWKELTQESKFQNLQILEAHYSQIEKKLERNINFYCYSVNLPKEKISQNIRKQLSQLIHLYQSIAKQLYFLSQLGAEDVPQQIAERIYSLKCGLMSINDDLIKTNRPQIEKDLDAFELALHEMAEKLSQLNYGQIDFAFIGKKEADLANHNIIVNVRRELARFRFISEFNTSITNFHSAIDVNDHVNVKKYQEELKVHIRLLQEIKIALTYIISESVDNCRELLKKLSNERQFIMDNLAFAQDYHCALSDVFHLVLKIRGYKTRSGEICKGYAEILEAAANNNIKSKYLSQSKLDNLVAALVKELEAFTDNYLKSFDECKKIKVELEKCQYLAREKETMLARTDSLVIKAKAVPEQCCEVIANVQNTLGEHLEANEDFVKSFFSQHWKGMLFGGTGGLGSGTLFAILTTGLHPASLIVLIAAGLVGTGLSGAAGLVNDYFQEKQIEKNAVNRKQPNVDQSSQSSSQQESTSTTQPRVFKWIYSLFHKTNSNVPVTNATAPASRVRLH